MKTKVEHSQKVSEGAKQLSPFLVLGRSVVLPEGVEDTGAASQAHGQIPKDVNVDAVFSGGKALDVALDDGGSVLGRLGEAKEAGDSLSCVSEERRGEGGEVNGREGASGENLG